MDNEMFRIREIVLFKVDGLDEPGIKQELEDRGAKVIDISDGTVGEGDDEEPIRVFLIDVDLAADIKIRRDFNCLSDPTNRYILWPMERK